MHLNESGGNKGRYGFDFAITLLWILFVFFFLLKQLKNFKNKPYEDLSDTDKNFWVYDPAILFF